MKSGEGRGAFWAWLGAAALQAALILAVLAALAAGAYYIACPRLSPPGPPPLEHQGPWKPWPIWHRRAVIWKPVGWSAAPADAGKWSGDIITAGPSCRIAFILPAGSIEEALSEFAAAARASKFEFAAQDASPEKGLWRWRYVEILHGWPVQMRVEARAMHADGRSFLLIVVADRRNFPAVQQAARAMAASLMWLGERPPPEASPSPPSMGE